MEPYLANCYNQEMDRSRKNTVHGSVKDLLLPVFIAGGLILLFLLWALVISGLNLVFNLRTLAEIHTHPAVWFAEVLILTGMMIIYRGYRKNQLRLKQLEEDIRSGEELFELNIRITESLIREDFDEASQLLEGDDKLGESLQQLSLIMKAGKRKEEEEYFITEGKNMISRILRLHNDVGQLADEVLRNLTRYLSMEQGALYLYDEESNSLTCVSTYAYNRNKVRDQIFRMGEGLVGQCAFEKDFVYRTEIPEDYVTFTSGILGDRKPSSILLVPLLNEESLQGVVEFASIRKKIPKLHIQFLLELGEVIGKTLHNLRMNSNTRRLLEESRRLTEELKRNEAELRDSAEMMKKTQLELERSNKQMEMKMQDAENIRKRLYQLLQNASEVISIYDREGRMKWVSPSVNHILGYSPEEMMEGKDTERINHTDTAKYHALIQDTLEGKNEGRKVQYSFIRKEGEMIYLESTARNLLNDPAIQGIIVNSRDITEMKRAEREERLRTRMQSLSENSMDMIMRMSTNGFIYYANPVVEEYVSMDAEQLNNQNISDLKFNSALHDYLTSTLKIIRENPVKNNQEIVIGVSKGKKITERIISIDAIPEFNGKELETVLFVGHDITEMKSIEKEVKEKNKNIEDSINYAEKIQSSLLPEIEMIQSTLTRSFVFYKPRDVISGDFPWFYTNGEDIFIAAVDCTGHGVPGSLLSFIAFFLLKDVVSKSGDLDAGQICDILNEQFLDTLKQNTGKSDSRDGLDIAFCKINLEKKLLQFAGAHRPLYHLNKGELMEYKGNRKAVGGLQLLRKADENFVNYDIPVSSGDRIFFFTDGLTDQLGGPHGRKYSPARVREKILENQSFTMKQYHQLFESEFEEWKQGFRQLDDVLMIGIEF